MNALLLALLLSAELVPAEPTTVTTDDLEDLKDELAKANARIDALERRASATSRLAARFKGYLDVGFFVVQGNGSGVRKDFGHTQADFKDTTLGSWVLMGDPLGTAINSRGEPADIGDSRAIRFDPIHAGGHPSFIVNTLHLATNVSLTQELSVIAAIDFLPRDRDLQDFRTIGDFFDLKLAFIRYQVDLPKVWLAIFVGKFDPLHGIEYRTQESPERIGVTPSLICRYTCGRPTGVKAKLGLFDRDLEIWLAVTNGSHQSDLFPFSNETDFNSGKTFAGRVQYFIPVGQRGLELSASGAIGPQDRQPDDGVLQWHYGFAGKLEVGDFIASAEFVTGRALGKTEVGGPKCGAAPCLFYRGAYGQLAYRVNSYLMPYARVDWRTARHQRGTDWAYVSTAVRGTFGLRADITSFITLKAEYVLNREVDILEFPDDIFTTSLVVAY